MEDMAEKNFVFLLNAKAEIYSLLEELRRDYDGSFYKQGKKDGVRLALALLGDADALDSVRGAPLGKPMPKEGLAAKTVLEDLLERLREDVEHEYTKTRRETRPELLMLSQGRRYALQDFEAFVMSYAKSKGIAL